MAAGNKDTKTLLETQLSELTELLRDQIIIQLGLAGVAQRNIRQILGVDITRVNRILKEINKGRRQSAKREAQR